MRAIARFSLHILVNAMAILASAWFIPGVEFGYNFLTLVWAAAILSLANFFLKPVIRLFFGPLIVISLGTFSLAINLFLIWFVTQFIPQFTINGLAAYLFTAVIVSVFNILVSLAGKK